MQYYACRTGIGEGVYAVVILLVGVALTLVSPAFVVVAAFGTLSLARCVCLVYGALMGESRFMRVSRRLFVSRPPAVVKLSQYVAIVVELVAVVVGICIVAAGFSLAEEQLERRQMDWHANSGPLILPIVIVVFLRGLSHYRFYKCVAHTERWLVAKEAFNALVADDQLEWQTQTMTPPAYTIRLPTVAVAQLPPAYNVV